jgi:hypothetical protein
MNRREFITLGGAAFGRLRPVAPWEEVGIIFYDRQV